MSVPLRAAVATGTLLLLSLSALHAADPAAPIVKVKRKVTDAEWTEYPARTLYQLPGLTVQRYPSPEPDHWGGQRDRKGERTGYFHAQKLGDRWWLVDPDGGLFLHVGVAAVDPGKTPTSRAALAQEYGTEKQWATVTTRQLRELGFNGSGAWSAVEPLRSARGKRLVYTVIGNAGAPGGGNAGGFMSSFGKKLRATRPGVGHTAYPNDCIPVFHPEFAAHCEEFARPLAALKDDPYLLGYFSDNELPYPRLENYLALSPDDPVMGSSYAAAKSWLEARKGNAAALTQEDKDAWTEHVYERYLFVTTVATRKADPHHMCLGPRFYGPEKATPGVFRAAGKFLDAIGVNLYFVWNPKPAEIQRWTEWSGKPVIITEWYAKGMDSGFPNTSGAGWTVPTQRDRGLFYQTFVLGLLEAKNCVGWHWFKYMDNDPTDMNAEASNRDANKGMVTNRFVPYAPLTEAMRGVNGRVYAVADYFDRKGAR